MPFVPVAGYFAEWRFNSLSGIIAFMTENSATIDAQFSDNPQEFQTIVDLPRNEKPLWYEIDDKVLRTSGIDDDETGPPGPVGEEEASS